VIEHERDVELREVPVLEVDDELLRQHVDDAVDLRLRLSRRLRQRKLVDAAEQDQHGQRNDELELGLHDGKIRVRGVRGMRFR
jgi:hypothetical protein